MNRLGLRRRALLGAPLVLPSALSLGGCGTGLSRLFGRKSGYTLSPRGDRMVKWLQNGGRDVMMAPEAFELMGITNGGRDIPVKQFAENGNDGRYAISLVNVRKIHEFVLHRRQGDVLVFHLCDTRFARLTSVRYPRNGQPTLIMDAAVAANDFQQQIGFWFERMPGR